MPVSCLKRDLLVHSAHTQRICDFVVFLKRSKALHCINGKAVYEVTDRDGNCQIFGLKCQRTLLENKSNQKLEKNWERMKEIMELRREEIIKEEE